MAQFLMRTSEKAIKAIKKQALDDDTSASQVLANSAAIYYFLRHTDSDQFTRAQLLDAMKSFTAMWGVPGNSPAGEDE